MPLHPQIASLLPQLQQLPPVTEFTPQQARAMATPPPPTPPDLTYFTVQEIVLSEYSAPLRLRIYRPPHPSPLPILVYFHGGGWVLGSLNAVDGICRYFAHHTPCIVVSVDYRCYEGMIHGFVALPPCPTLGYSALQDLVKQLQIAFYESVS